MKSHVEHFQCVVVCVCGRCLHPDRSWSSDDGGGFPGLLWSHSGVSLHAGTGKSNNVRGINACVWQCKTGFTSSNQQHRLLTGIPPLNATRTVKLAPSSTCFYNFNYYFVKKKTVSCCVFPRWSLKAKAGQSRVCLFPVSS